MGKYKKGSRITCLEELVRQDVVFFRDKVLHRSFFQLWQIRYAIIQIERGTLFRADERSVPMKDWNRMFDGSDYEKEFWGEEVDHE